MTEPATFPDPSATPAAELDQAVLSPPATDAGSVGEQVQIPSGFEHMSIDEMTAAYEAQEAAREAAEASGQIPAPQAPPAVAAVPEGDGPLNFRVSVKDRDEVTAKAIAMVAHNPGVSIEEAVALIKGRMPAPVEGSAPSPTAPVTPPLTVADITARQEALNLELQAAHAEMDFETAGRLQVEGLALVEQKLFAAQRQAAADAQAQTAAEAEWDRFNAQASGMYPEATQEGSAFHATMKSIFDAMEAAGDPLLDQPISTLRIAQMAAARLGVAPVTAKVVPVQTPSHAAPAPTPPATPRLRPMDGGTSQGVGATAASTAAALAAARSLTSEQWEAISASI